MRCLALGLAWKKRGGQVIVCGYIESQTLKSRIAADGFEIIEPAVGVEATVRSLGEYNLKTNWIVLDGYHFGPEWQEILDDAGYSVLRIDDIAPIPYPGVKVILAPNSDPSHLNYPGQYDALLLLGPRYRLLRPEFLDHLRPSRSNKVGFVVLVNFGGSDTRNITLSVLLALDGVLGQHDKVIAVLGPLNQNQRSIEHSLTAVSYRHQLLHDVEDMVSVFDQADLAIGAVGGTAWEMAAAGLPAVLIPLTENQVPGAEYLDREGSAIYLSYQNGLEDGKLAATVKKLMNSPAFLAAMSSAGPKVCDGKGPERVCKILSVLSDRNDGATMLVRRALEEDIVQIYRLANDPVVRQNSFSSAPIPFRDHATWYANRLASRDTIFYVLDLEGVITALVRYDRKEDEFEVDVAVHKAFRGNRLGSKILRETVEVLTKASSVTGVKAIVFEENTASRRCFLRAGFQEIDRSLIKGKACLTYRFDIKRGASH